MNYSDIWTINDLLKNLCLINYYILGNNQIVDKNNTFIAFHKQKKEKIFKNKFL